MSGDRFRPDIEGLRALAVLLVLVYHAVPDLLPGGYVGVDVFFVISGYLITGSLIAEASGTGRVSLARFYARRVRRLLPAAATVLGATAVGVWLLLPATSWRDFGGDIAAAAAYVVNWRLRARSVDYLAEDVAASPVQHFWTLSVEEQFYVIWPLLIVAATWLAIRRRWRVDRALVWTVVLAVAVPSLLHSLLATAAEPARAFFDTGTRLWEMALGAIAAGIAPWFVRVPGAVRAIGRSVALAVLLGVAFTVTAGSPWPGWLALGVAVPTAVVILLGRRPPDDPHRDVVDCVLGWRPAQRIGAWSYSLYLWHWPPLAILGARWGGLSATQGVLIVVASVVPAVLSYRYIETPVRRKRWTNGFTLSVGVNLTLVSVLAGLALALATPSAPPTAAGNVVGGAALPDNPQDAELLATLDDVKTIVPDPTLAVDDIPITYAEGCQVPTAEPDPVVCSYGGPSDEPHVALVGDSKAAQWVTPLLQHAERGGWRLWNITKSACELSRSMPERDGEPFTECAVWGEQVLNLLRDDPPDLVLVSQGSSRAYVEPGSGRDPSESLIEGMVASYRVLEEAGVRVVILLDNPPPRGNVYECVAEHRDDLRRCGFERPLDGGGRSVQLMAAERGGFEVLDLADLVCPTETCLPVIGDVLVYRQGSHLTDTYVRSVGDELVARVEAMLPGRS
ncbi:acyltransferase [Nitriliruptoraceae bacterium ZYF776]|nr:acyltransferase [Profundirhabdus halotolerans]